MDNITIKIEEGFVGQKMIVLPPDRKKLIIKNPLSRYLYPTAIGFYPNASYHDRERKDGSEQYILLYCIDGKGWIKIENEEHILSPNTVFIIPKNIPHHYGSSQKEPWSIYWVHFSGEQAELLYARYAALTGKTVSDVAFTESRIELFDKLVVSLEDDFTGVELETIYIKLLQFIASFIYADGNNTSLENDVIASSVSLMKSNIKKNYQVIDLAAHVHYSVSHYSELFRRKTGFSPIQYFIQLKIQKSCQYLYFTKMNIKEICREVGFDDPYYFSRMFKKQLGQSPLQYRKAHKV
jgi:AraC family transcriptional regulator of arabinose operon